MEMGETKERHTGLEVVSSTFFKAGAQDVDAGYIWKRQKPDGRRLASALENSNDMPVLVLDHEENTRIVK
jgi:hypothetical protein